MIRTLRNPPANYWRIETNDTGHGFTAIFVRTEWNVEDWRIPWTYARARGYPKAKRGALVIVPGEHVLIRLALRYIVPRLRDHDLFYVPISGTFARVGELLRAREKPDLRRALRLHRLPGMR